jgi:enoyl-CoA hydratase
MTEWVSYSREGAVGVVTMDRPPLNVLDLAFLGELLAAFTAAKDDSECRAVVLESACPKVYCAGLNLKAAQGWSRDELRAILNRLYLELMDLQRAMGKPTIAAPHGIVRGGGITLSIQCDVIVADESVDIAYSEIDAGVVPAIHFSHLPSVAGRHLAFAPLFTGNAFGAETAHRLGLVDRVAPSGNAGAVARALAEEFASKPPTTMKLGRDAFHRVNDQGHRDRVVDVIETFIECFFGPDGQEGIAAFVEKRKPAWQA